VLSGERIRLWEVCNLATDLLEPLPLAGSGSRSITLAVRPEITRSARPAQGCW